MGVQANTELTNGASNTALGEEGGDVERGQNSTTEVVIVSQADLVRLGHKSIDDYIRHEILSSQGAVAGFNSGVDAVSTLHVGLTDEGRRVFREAMKPAIEAFYADSGS